MVLDCDSRDGVRSYMMQYAVRTLNASNAKNSDTVEKLQGQQWHSKFLACEGVLNDGADFDSSCNIFQLFEVVMEVTLRTCKVAGIRADNRTEVAR